MDTQKLIEVAKKAYREAPTFWTIDRTIESIVFCIVAEIRRNKGESHEQ